LVPVPPANRIGNPVLDMGVTKFKTQFQFWKSDTILFGFLIPGTGTKQFGPARHRDPPNTENYPNLLG
jgi:hypothetical protein